MLVAGLDGDAGDLDGHEALRAEALGLLHRAARQFTAADTGRESQVVLDPRTGASLPAGGMPVEQQRLQAFRGAIHRGRQARRTAADDHQVVDVERRGKRSAEALGHLPGLRAAQDGAILEEQDRQRVVMQIGGARAAPARPGFARRRANGTA